jgi:hypothetical protein
MMFVLGGTLVCTHLTSALAASIPDTLAPSPPTPDVKNEIPILAYTYEAAGVSPGSLGAQAYGLGSGATGGVGLFGEKHGVLGGGVTFWGSPIDRLTLIGDAPRDVTGNFAPSAAVVLRLLGHAGEGWSLGLLGKFKVEGFGVGKNDEIESEIEGGVLLAFARDRWRIDLNAVTGFGTGDDGEIDSEARLRAGANVSRVVFLGIDGQARYRLEGTEKLIGGRAGDFQGGPQVLLGSGHFYGAITAGPTTTNVFSGLGWGAAIALGGTTL